MSLEPWICSWSVRSTGDNLELPRASKGELVRGKGAGGECRLIRPSPYSVESDSTSQMIVSESNGIVGHSAAVRELLAGVGTPFPYTGNWL